MTTNQRYWIALVTSLVIAFLGWSAPTDTVPLNYHAMIFRSVPFAVAWVTITAFSVWHFRKRGLWLLLGAPMALYWPIWLLLIHLPPCYYSHNCV